MKNPAYDYTRDPDTPTNVTKIAKKEALTWIVRGLCLVACLGLAAIARLWADDRYTQKIDFVSSQSSTAQQFKDETARREALEASYQDTVRKLDLIIYILQHDNKINPQDMKGKLGTP